MIGRTRCRVLALSNAALLAVSGLVATAPANAQDGATADRKSQQSRIDRLEAELRSARERVSVLERQLAQSRYPAPASIPPDPGPLQIDAAAADRALERSLANGGAILLPRGVFDVSVAGIYADTTRSFPVFVTNGGDLAVGRNSVENSILGASIQARLGLPMGFQFETGLPWLRTTRTATTLVGDRPAFPSQSDRMADFGNFQLGLAKALWREGAARPSAVARVTWDIGIGDGEGPDLETGETIGGSLTFVKRADPMVFVGSASYRTAIGDAAFQPGNQVGVSLLTALAASPSTSISFKFDNRFYGDAEFDGQVMPDSDYRSHSFGLGVSNIIGRGTLLSLQGTIGISERAPDYIFAIALSRRLRLY